MGSTARKFDDVWTYQDYMTWNDGQRWDEIVERYLLSDGRYGSPEIFDWTEILTLCIFPDLTLNLWEIFDKKLPTEKPVTRGPMTS